MWRLYFASCVLGCIACISLLPFPGGDYFMIFHASGRYSSYLHAVALLHNAFLDTHFSRLFYNDTHSRASLASNLRDLLPTSRLHKKMTHDAVAHRLRSLLVLILAGPPQPATVGSTGGTFSCGRGTPRHLFFIRGRNGRTALHGHSMRRELGLDEDRRGGCIKNTEDQQRRILAEHTW